MVNWYEIHSEQDAKALLDAFGWFHDGCIKELHVSTEYYVSPELGMAVSMGDDCTIRMLVQRQFNSPSAIELVFSGVTYFRLTRPTNYDSIIFEATIIVVNGKVYWADVGGWTLEKRSAEDCTLVEASQLIWRDASDWMGPDMRYGPRPETHGQLGPMVGRGTPISTEPRSNNWFLRIFKRLARR